MVSQNYTGVNFLSRRNIENWHETHQPSDVTLETFNVINVFVSRPLIWEWFQQTDEQLKPLFRLTNVITASCKINWFWVDQIKTGQKWDHDKQP